MAKYHSREYDLTSKELFQSLKLPLLQYLIGKPVQLLQALNVGFVRIESRDTDMIYDAIVDQQPAIVHLEVQSANDKTMLARMLRYLAEIYAVHQLPVYQCVVYLGKAPVAMQSELSFALDTHSKLDYRYQILALNQLPFEDVAKMEPIDFLALLPLTHSDLDAEQHLNRSVQVVTERSQGLDFNRRSNLLLKTEIFAGLRFDPILIEQVFEEVMTMFQIEESSTYQMILEKGKIAGRAEGRQEGHQEGLQEGRQEGLIEAQERFSQRIIEILRKRFGPVPVALTERLQGLNLKQLDQALANALEADRLETFIDSL